MGTALARGRLVPAGRQTPHPRPGRHGRVLHRPAARTTGGRARDPRSVWPWPARWGRPPLLPRPAGPAARRSDFPAGILVVNVSGSLLLGLLVGSSLHHGVSPYWVTVAGTGLRRRLHHLLHLHLRHQCPPGTPTVATGDGQRGGQPGVGPGGRRPRPGPRLPDLTSAALHSPDQGEQAIVAQCSRNDHRGVARGSFPVHLASLWCRSEVRAVHGFCRSRASGSWWWRTRSPTAKRCPRGSRARGSRSSWPPTAPPLSACSPTVPRTSSCSTCCCPACTGWRYADGCGPWPRSPS